jgi:hypothetical protein
MAGRTEASFLSIGTLLTVVTLAVSGGMYVGGVAGEVDDLTAAQAKAAEDHDRLVKVENDVEHIKDDVEETKDDVKEILKQLQQLNGHTDSND